MSEAAVALLIWLSRQQLGQLDYPDSPFTGGGRDKNETCMHVGMLYADLDVIEGV